MEEEVAALLQSAGAASAKAVAESEDKLAMKVRYWCACVFVYVCYVQALTFEETWFGLHGTVLLARPIFPLILLMSANTFGAFLRLFYAFLKRLRQSILCLLKMRPRPKRLLPPPCPLHPCLAPVGQAKLLTCHVQPTED
eukprot:1161798-Pelagomonas_calceolata.AAC.9